MFLNLRFTTMGAAMPTVSVEPSSAIEMIGPYLAAKVICPHPDCKKENIFLRSEGPLSDVKVVEVCSHVKAHYVDDDCLSQFEFTW